MRERAWSRPCCPWCRRRADADAQSRRSRAVTAGPATRPRSCPRRRRPARARAAPPRLDLETLDDAPVHEVLVDDLVDVFLVDVRVPGALGIHHDAGALLAAVQAARRVDAHLAGAVHLQLLDALLGVLAHALRVVVGAARLGGIAA